MKTDAQLCADVADALAWVPAVDASRIGVEVHEGVVTLQGSVHDCAGQWAAEQAAGGVDGIRTLISELEVAPAQARCCDDASIARAAEQVLLWLTSLPPGALRVRVDAGWITLSGEVDWDYQRQAAADVVRRLSGVAGVSDCVTLSPAQRRSARPVH